MRTLSRHRETLGFSLIELLTSMAVLSVLLLMLTQALDASLKNWVKVSSTTNLQSDLRSAAAWLRKDLGAAVTTRYANLPRGDFPESQRQFFENRLLFPVEIDREESSGALEKSFENAADGFSQIAFIMRATDGTLSQSLIDRASTESSQVADTVRSDSSFSDGSLAGFYVAWTRDSPLGDDSRRSMKLYRHFRPSGPSWGAGRSRGVIAAVSSTINDEFTKPSSSPKSLPPANKAILRQGKFSNAAFPFLFAERFDQQPEAGTVTPVSAPQPWPALSSDKPSPPSFGWDEWNDPESTLNEYLFADEPLIERVVRFEIQPYRRVTYPDGTTDVLGTEGIVDLLGHSSSDWPALVAPHFLEITIGVVPDTVANLLSDEDDWLIDWANAKPSATGTSPSDLVINKVETTTIRVPIATGAY